MTDLNLPLPTEETPLYKKWYFWLLVVLVIWIAVSLVNQSLAQRGWSKEFKCTSWMPHSQRDYDSGKQCSLVFNCIKIDDGNRVVEQCTCNYKEENTTFNLIRICVEGYDIKKYNWTNQFYDNDLNKTVKFGS